MRVYFLIHPSGRVTRAELYKIALRVAYAHGAIVVERDSAGALCVLGRSQPDTEGYTLLGVALEKQNEVLALVRESMREMERG